MMAVWHGFYCLLDISSLTFDTTNHDDDGLERECLLMLISSLVFFSLSDDSDIPKREATRSSVHESFNLWRNIFWAWDNIWLFNGATYFMKSTNKHQHRRVHHKPSRIYWILTINKARFSSYSTVSWDDDDDFSKRQKLRCQSLQRSIILPSTGHSHSPRKIQWTLFFALVPAENTQKIFGPKHSIWEFRVQHQQSERISWRLIYICFLFASTCALCSFEHA